MNNIKLYDIGPYRLVAQGLEAPGEPLHIIAYCTECSKELTRQTYTQEEMAKGTVEDLILRVQQSATLDSLRAMAHECVTH